MESPSSVNTDMSNSPSESEDEVEFIGVSRSCSGNTAWSKFACLLGGSLVRWGGEIKLNLVG